MSRISKSGSHKPSSDLVEVKSKFDAEFRRFVIDKSKSGKLEDFRKLLSRLHQIEGAGESLTYIDPLDGYLLPITNDDNYRKALESGKPTLKVIIQRQGQINTTGGIESNKLPSILSPFVSSHSKNKLVISEPQNFRQVAAIIDVDVVPEVCRRVKLLKHDGTDKPLGFYIRDGSSVKVTPTGIERVPGIFISRLVPGGLAESTGLLAVNDEVIEVNGIEVQCKNLDQVTDMMVANSKNLIITVKPANQRTVAHGPNRGSFSRNSAISSNSQQSAGSDDDHDNDEIKDLTQSIPVASGVSSDEGILHL